MKIDLDGLPAMELGEASPELAQSLLAAAASGPRERTVAQGIVTAIASSSAEPASRVPYAIIQTDIAVGPMSAGGPVVDADGWLIGIVVAKRSQDARQPGPAYAIPASYVKMLLEARKGEDPVVVERPNLGVVLGYQEEPRVSKVVPNTPASEAGIREGDRITAVDGVPISRPQDVVVQVGKQQPSETITITIERDGVAEDVEVALAPVPKPQATVAAAPAVIAEPRGRIAILGKDGELVYVTPRSPEALAEAWKQAGTQPMRPAIRVERSDTEKALADLSAQVTALHEQLRVIREELNKLNERLDQE